MPAKRSAGFEPGPVEAGVRRELEGLPAASADAPGLVAGVLAAARLLDRLEPGSGWAPAPLLREIREALEVLRARERELAPEVSRLDELARRRGA